MIAPPAASDKINRARAQQTATPVVDCSEALKRAALPASGPPLVCDEPAATYERASDEHGRLAVSAATNRLQIGDKIRLVPGHCDPTVNL